MLGLFACKLLRGQSGAHGRVPYAAGHVVGQRFSDVRACGQNGDVYKRQGCSHTVEKGCAVRAALEAGEIDKTRYESYVTLYNEAKEVKEWQM